MLKLSKKPGDIVESSKIKVLENNKCIIISGFGSGDIVSIDDWYLFSGKNIKKLIPSENSAFTIVSRPKKESFFSFIKKKLLFYPF